MSETENFAKLIDVLTAYQDSVDMWSDDIVFYAARLIDDLNEEDWLQLNRIWRAKPANWQAKLADALYSSAWQEKLANDHLGSRRTPEIDLLVDMLQSPHLEAAIAASETMAAMDHVWQPDASLRPVLLTLKELMTGPDRYRIEKIVT